MAITSPRPLVGDDNRGDFDCGRASMNNWLVRHAWNNQKNDATRTNVICNTNNDDLVGYVTLSATHIARSVLAKSQQRNKPDPVPAMLLGQLAVDIKYQGQGYAASLLHFAMKTTLNFSDHVGCYGLITHPLDDEIRKFYQKHGFKDIPYDPRQAMIVRMIDLVKSGF